MSAVLDNLAKKPAQNPEALLSSLLAPLRVGEIVPYLGPGVAALSRPDIPVTPEALAEFFGTKVALPRRAKGNAWTAAQHIESMKHRSTLTSLMKEAFGSAVTPGPLHHHLATLNLPMIVDTWYDGAMRAALGADADWGEVQGNTRAGIGEDRWYRFYDSKGAEASREAAQAWRTLLYKPHGSILPAANFLISDADYVEVLTEIDIQTPIPDAVKDRRTGRGFLYIGCRFNDQLLRTYARQISKRSSTRQYVIIDPDILSRNEICFLSTQGLTAIALPLPQAIEIITAAS